MRVTLTRTVEFRATHAYWVPEWSAERNRAQFGAAVQPHPHDYRCSVTVSGALEPETDTIMALPALDALLQEEVLARFADKFLNKDTPEFSEAGIQPSCEALARYCFMRISARLPAGVTLERVRIAEDPSLYGECVRNGQP